MNIIFCFTQLRDDRHWLEEDFLNKVPRQHPSHMLLRRHQHQAGDSVYEMSEWHPPSRVPDWSFFKLPEHSKHEDLFRTLSRKEQGYDKVTVHAGLPKVTDEIMTKKGLNKKSLDSEAGDEIDSLDQSPNIAKLGVVGREYHKNQVRIKQLQWQETEIEIQQDILTSPSGSSTTDVFLPTKMNVIPREEEPTQTYSSTSSVAASSRRGRHHHLNCRSEVGLQLGNISLSYSKDPERAEQEHIVACGCSAEVGQNGYNKVFMKNTGTTVIHFRYTSDSLIF